MKYKYPEMVFKTDDLKHCPFCGGEAVEDLGTWFIRCTKCGCAFNVPKEDKWRDVFNAWNRRARTTGLVKDFHKEAMKGGLRNVIQKKNENGISKSI